MHMHNRNEFAVNTNVIARAGSGPLMLGGGMGVAGMRAVRRERKKMKARTSASSSCFYLFLVRAVVFMTGSMHLCAEPVASRRTKDSFFCTFESRCPVLPALLDRRTMSS